MIRIDSTNLLAVITGLAVCNLLAYGGRKKRGQDSLDEEETSPLSKVPKVEPHPPRVILRFIVSLIYKYKCPTFSMRWHIFEGTVLPD